MDNMPTGLKGFQKGNKFQGCSFPKGNIPWNKGLIPEDQPNYKDGRSFKRGFDWKIQKEKCYKRDRYKCRKCKKTNSVIQCHHLVDWNKTHDNKLSNLITLCLGCHVKIHNNGFKKGNEYWKNRKYHITPNGKYKNR